MILGHHQLDALIYILQQYLESAKTTTPPSKDLLRQAVLSLIQEGTALSHRWDKTQLALIVQKWALSALRLSPRHVQTKLFVQAKMVVENRKKVLSHKCFLKDEHSEEVVELSIASPSPVKAVIPVKKARESREESDGEATETFELSNDFDEDFLKEIDELAQQADLAAIPVHFYTPGVEPIPGRDANVPG